MLFIVFRYLAEDSTKRSVVEWVLTDELPVILDHGYPNVEFLAPGGFRVDIPILDLHPSPDQGHQFFQHELAKVTAPSGVIVNNCHLVRHR